MGRHIPTPPPLGLDIDRCITQSSFLHRLTWLPGQYNEKIAVESFRKKNSTKPRKSQALTWGARNQYSSINFPGTVFVANVHNFYTVAFGCGKS